MSKRDNSYLCNQLTAEKNYTKQEKDEDFNSSKYQKYLNEYKNNLYQTPFSDIRKINKIRIKLDQNKEITENPKISEINNINKLVKRNNKYFFSSNNIDDIYLKCKKIKNNNNKLNKFINNKEIQPYNNRKKEVNYHRSNSIAYIKKRPNDLIKVQNSNDNLMIAYTLRNSFGLKVRCLSSTNIKKYNFFENFDYTENNNNSSKKKYLPKSYPSDINKNKEEKIIKQLNIIHQNKMLLKYNIFCNNIFNVIKNHLYLNKIIFFKNIKSVKQILMYEVSPEEYEFLEELKALGVTSKKELNLLLKDIYISIKGSEGINDVEIKK